MHRMATGRLTNRYCDTAQEPQGSNRGQAVTEVFAVCSCFCGVSVFEGPKHARLALDCGTVISAERKLFLFDFLLSGRVYTCHNMQESVLSFQCVGPKDGIRSSGLVGGTFPYPLSHFPQSQETGSLRKMSRATGLKNRVRPSQLEEKTAFPC